jgi:hypothetical protein
MAAPVVLPRPPVAFGGNAGATAVAHSPADENTHSCRAVAYQRVLHQLMRREWRVMAELATWAAPDDKGRTRTLAQHAELLGRVLLHHHAVERERIWPALQRAVGDDPSLQAAVDDWTGRCARIDHVLRDVGTAARQWAVTGTARARDAFAMVCLDLADSIDRQTAEEERTLLPLLGRHLDASEWRAITRAARCPLSPAEQLFVFGLALEDSCAAERRRLLSGLPRPARWVWHSTGRSRYRAAVVRLRGAPPAR